MRVTDLNELLQYLKEDTPAGDVTSDAIIPDVCCTAVIRTEQDGVLAGVEEAAALFSYFGTVITSRKNDGDSVKSGDVILSLSGRAKIQLPSLSGR